MALQPGPAFACARCRPAVQAQIYDGRFLPNLMLLLLPLAMVGLVAAILHFRDEGDSDVPARKGPSV